MHNLDRCIDETCKLTKLWKKFMTYGPKLVKLVNSRPDNGRTSSEHIIIVKFLLYEQQSWHSFRLPELEDNMFAENKNYIDWIIIFCIVT